MPDIASELKEKVLSPVVLTQEVFDEICQFVCPHCRREKPGLRFRIETAEYVHDSKHATGLVTHTICWANGFRKSRFAELVKNG